MTIPLPETHVSLRRVLTSGRRDQRSFRRTLVVTHEELGSDWSKSKVKQYSSLLSNVVTRVLEMARNHQKGRGTDEVPNGTFNFTEGWFRTRGLYNLEVRNQYSVKSNVPPGTSSVPRPSWWRRAKSKTGGTTLESTCA